MFSEVTTRRSADAVFDQVCEQIVDGSLEPGTTLPAERELAAQLNVSRSVVREALQRLAQAGLVEIRHGGSSRVRDFQSGTDIEMLGRLLVHADGSIDAIVLRSMLEMRICIGADAARLCAMRTSPQLSDDLGGIVDRSTNRRRPRPNKTSIFSSGGHRRHRLRKHRLPPGLQRTRGDVPAHARGHRRRC